MYFIPAFGTWILLGIYPVKVPLFLKRQVFEEVGRGVWLITSATNTLLAVDV